MVLVVQQADWNCQTVLEVLRTVRMILMILEAHRTVKIVLKVFEYLQTGWMVLTVLEVQLCQIVVVAQKSDLIRTAGWKDRKVAVILRTD